MSNPLLAARDAFAARHPEMPLALSGRAWGMREAGTGPALLLIPGTLGRGYVFWQQVEALSARLRVVTLSYPASGGIEDWTSDLATLLDRLGIAQDAILGSSLGGYLAQYFAATHPTRVSHLIAANTLHSAHGIAQRPPYAFDLDHVPVADLRGGFSSAMEGWGESHPEQADLVELLLGEVHGRIPEPELRTRLKALKTAPELPPLTLPEAQRFTIDAADDPLIPPEMRTAVQARVQPAVAYHFRSGGHFPYVVHPQAYTALIEEIMGLPLTSPGWGTGKDRTK